MNLKLHRYCKTPTSRNVVGVDGSIHIVADKSHSECEMVRCATLAQTPSRIEIVISLNLSCGTTVFCNAFTSRPLQLTSRAMRCNVDSDTGCLYGELSEPILTTELPSDLITPCRKRRSTQKSNARDVCDHMEDADSDSDRGDGDDGGESEESQQESEATESESEPEGSGDEYFLDIFFFSSLSFLSFFSFLQTSFSEPSDEKWKSPDDVM